MCFWNGTCSYIANLLYFQKVFNAVGIEVSAQSSIPDMKNVQPALCSLILFWNGEEILYLQSDVCEERQGTIRCLFFVKHCACHFPRHFVEFISSTKVSWPPLLNLLIFPGFTLCPSGVDQNGLALFCTQPHSGEVYLVPVSSASWGVYLPFCCPQRWAYHEVNQIYA